jgi:hypothetical protein
MAEIELVKTDIWEVEIIESERGWGRKIDETKYFSDHQSATDFWKQYNSKNDQTIVTNWYMYADNPTKKTIYSIQSNATNPLDGLIEQINKLPARCGRIKRSDVIQALQNVNEAIK